MNCVNCNRAEPIDGELNEVRNSPAPIVDVKEEPIDEHENAPLPSAKRARVGEPVCFVRLRLVDSEFLQKLPLRESNVTQRRVTRASRRAQQ